MIRKLCILGLGLIALTPAFSMDAAQSAAKEIIALQNGETLYIFKDGLMAKESRYGRATYLANDSVVKSEDGRSITTRGNEVARLSTLLKQGHR